MRSWSRVPSWRPIDEWDAGFGWLLNEAQARASHALVVEGRVYLVDPVDVPELEPRIRALGEPAAVLQLLDRHRRGTGAWSRRLAVPIVRAWASTAGVPFEPIPVRDNRVWREAALWEPLSRTLLCGDVLGTLTFFRAGGERIGWHPLIRPFPPNGFRGVRPARILVGHGEGIHSDATELLADVVVNGRRRVPRALAAVARAVVRR